MRNAFLQRERGVIQLGACEGREGIGECVYMFAFAWERERGEAFER